MYAQGFRSVGRAKLRAVKTPGEHRLRAPCRVSSHCRSPKGDLA